MDRQSRCSLRTSKKKYSIRKTSHLITYQARRKVNTFGGDNSTGKYSSESFFCLSENFEYFSSRLCYHVKYSLSYIFNINCNQKSCIRKDFDIQKCRLNHFKMFDESLGQHPIINLFAPPPPLTQLSQGSSKSNVIYIMCIMLSFKYSPYLTKTDVIKLSTLMLPIRLVSAKCHSR